MSEPRFYVSVYGDTAYVYDRLYNCRLLASYTDDCYGKQREPAEQYADELNRWWRLELARG